MAYEKLNFNVFKTNLKEGKYNSPAGARRAVGKADTITSAEKEAANKLIDAHFGVEAGAKKEKAQAAKKGAAKKAAVKAPTPKKAPAKAPAKSAVKEPTKRQPKTAKEPEARAASTQLPLPGVLIPDFNDASSPLTQMRMAEHSSLMANQSLSALAAAKTACPEIETAPAMEECSNLLQSSIGIFRHLVDNVKMAQAASTVRATTGRKPKAPLEEEPEEEPEVDELPSEPDRFTGISEASRASSIL